MKHRWRFGFPRVFASLASSALGRRQGDLRHELARRSRARRLLSGGRRRHLRQIRARRDDRARAARRPTTAFCSPPASSTSTWAATCCSPSTRSTRICRSWSSPRFPERPADRDVPSRRRASTTGARSAQGDRLHRQGGAGVLLSLDGDRVRLQGGERQAVHVQSGAVHRRQELRSSRATSPRSRSRSRSEGDFKPNIFLFADQGYSTYATTIETRADIVAKHPDLVQRFVDASTIGWYNYLYGDNSKANARIKKDNPDMTDEQIAFSIGKIKEYGLVDSGDTLKLGIGAMTDARVKSFYDADGEGRRRQARSRLQEGLHAAIRRQGRRPRPSAEVGNAPGVGNRERAVLARRDQPVRAGGRAHSCIAPPASCCV